MKKLTNSNIVPNMDKSYPIGAITKSCKHSVSNKSVFKKIKKELSKKYKTTTIINWNGYNSGSEIKFSTKNSNFSVIVWDDNTLVEITEISKHILDNIEATLDINTLEIEIDYEFLFDKRLSRNKEFIKIVEQIKKIFLPNSVNFIKSL